MIDDHTGWAFLAVAFMGAVLGAMIAYSISSASWKQEAVDQGCAEYSTQTGEWSWNQ